MKQKVKVIKGELFDEEPCLILGLAFKPKDIPRSVYPGERLSSKQAEYPGDWLSSKQAEKLVKAWPPAKSLDVAKSVIRKKIKEQTFLNEMDKVRALKEDLKVLNKVRIFVRDMDEKDRPGELPPNKIPFVIGFAFRFEPATIVPLASTNLDAAHKLLDKAFGIPVSLFMFGGGS